MTRDDPDAVAQALARLHRRLLAEERLQPELQRARREFFGVERPDPARDAATEQRFVEWFALERASDTLGEVPIDVPPFADSEPELAGSMASMFVVTAASSIAVTARDLQDDGMLELQVPPGSLQVGDVLAGRLYPRTAGTWQPSTAAAVFRPGGPLATALRHDLQRLDLGRRLQQIEIEHLLLHRQQTATSAPLGDVIPLEHLEAELEKLLADAGSELDAAAISEQLAGAARPGPVLGPLLEELAFDTKIDLDRVRRLAMQIWNAHHRDDPAPAAGEAMPEAPAAPGETLGERLARTLEEGLAQKRDVEELFQQLGRMAGIDPAELDDDAESAATDDEEDPAEPGADDGTLGPLVEEYLWETGRDETPAADALRQWAPLQHNAPVPHGDLADVTPTDVLRLLLHVYLGAAPGTAAERVRAVFAELRAFAEWAAATQEFELQPVLDRCSGTLLEQLDRLQSAADALTTANGERARPTLLQVEAIDARGFFASDDDGGEPWITASPQALASLRQGDLVLGALAPVRGGETARQLCGRVVVLPADARALME